MKYSVFFPLILSLSMAVIADEGITPSLDLSWATRIQKQVDGLDATIKKDVRLPTGAIVAFYGDKAPKGWMLCDGSTIPSDFEELRKVVGDRVPDLRGNFLRGANNGRSDGKGDLEQDRKIGSYQEDMFKKHTHGLNLQGASGDNAYVNRSPAWGYDDWHGALANVNTSEQGGGETRPKNIAVNFIIKI